MAAPGLGAGDILTACKFIYDICVKYKDAPEQFDEIAEKAGATKDVIERLELEAATCGSLVSRAGEGAEEQFQGHLNGLRTDLVVLQKLVEKYGKIHDEGPGRRLLWAVWESSNLTEYRRKISYHEAKLNIWYTTLVYGSLRRLETGQEGLLEALKDLSANQEKVIRDALKKHGDPRPLYRVLEQKGVPRQSIDANLPLATNYVTADPETQCKMTDHVRQRSHESRMSGMHNTFDTSAPRNSAHRYDSGRDTGLKPGSKPGFTSGKGGKSDPPDYRQYTAGTGDIPYFPPYKGNKNDIPPMYFSFDKGGFGPGSGPGPGPSRSKADKYTREDEVFRTLNTEWEAQSGTGRREKELRAKEPQAGLRRSKSSRKAKEHKLESEAGDHVMYVRPRPEISILNPTNTGKMGPDDFRPGHARRKSDTPLPRRSKSPLIVIDDDGPTIRINPTHRRTRSTSTTATDRRGDYEVPVIVVEEEGSRRSRSRASESGSRHRDESTSSYHRERPRSSSGGSDRGVRQYRIVRKMDRIDSLPIDEGKK